MAWIIELAPLPFSLSVCLCLFPIFFFFFLEFFFFFFFFLCLWLDNNGLLDEGLILEALRFCLSMLFFFFDKKKALTIKVVFHLINTNYTRQMRSLKS
jgi:hypothetical protein